MVCGLKVFVKEDISTETKAFLSTMLASIPPRKLVNVLPSVMRCGPQVLKSPWYGGELFVTTLPYLLADVVIMFSPVSFIMLNSDISIYEFNVLGLYTVIFELIVGVTT